MGFSKLYEEEKGKGNGRGKRRSWKTRGFVFNINSVVSSGAYHQEVDEHHFNIIDDR